MCSAAIGLSIWREVVGRAILVGRSHHAARPPVRFKRIDAIQPEFRVALLRQSGLRIERTYDLLMDGTDDLALQICTAGTLIVSQRAQETVLHRGDATLLSAAETVSIACPSPARFVHVQLPRKALALLVPSFDDAIMRAIPRDSEALRLLAGYARMVGADQSMTSPDFSRLVTSHLHDLVAASLGATGDAAALADEGGIRAARLRAIKADITGRLADHDLSVASVAARQHVTPRYVQALFEREGTTLSAFVLYSASPARTTCLLIRGTPTAPSTPSRTKPASAIARVSIGCSGNATALHLRRYEPRGCGRGMNAPCQMAPHRDGRLEDLSSPGTRPEDKKLYPRTERRMPTSGRRKRGRLSILGTTSTLVPVRAARRTGA